MNARTPAIFLDRDGTLIRDVGYLWDPARVELLDGVVPALHQLKAAGYRLIVVTNQGGVGLGLMTTAQVDAVHDHMQKEFQKHQMTFDAIYYCCHHPRGTGDYGGDHPWRKPAPGMLLTAAEQHGLDLPRSWIIGDAERDTEAGLAAGCCAVWLRQAVGDAAPPKRAHAVVDHWRDVPRRIAERVNAGVDGRTPPTPVGTGIGN